MANVDVELQLKIMDMVELLKTHGHIKTLEKYILYLTNLKKNECILQGKTQTERDALAGAHAALSQFLPDLIETFKQTKAKYSKDKDEKPPLEGAEED